jgi:hypothetical protein
MFVKLFNQILDSSIADDRKLRHFFTDILLCSDAQGFVMMTESAIARRIGASIDEVKWGIDQLMSPDPRSKTPDNEGRRLEAVDGSGYGWRIINFESYKALRSAEDMREKTRERVRRFRDKQKDSDPCNATVTPCNAGNTTKRKRKNEEEELPPNPQRGDVGEDLPKRSRRLSAADKKRIRVKSNTPTMIRIGEWFGRQESTLWTIAEAEALESTNPSPAEIDGMEGYYSAKDIGTTDYRRKDLLTLLNNWPGELDRARGYYKERGQM